MTKYAVITGCLEGRGFSPAAYGARRIGPLGPEATMPQGLKPPIDKPFSRAGLKPRPSKALANITRTFVSKYYLPP